MMISAGISAGFFGSLSDPIQEDGVLPAQCAAAGDKHVTKGGAKLDILIVDACIMGSTETRYTIERQHPGAA